jgi:pyridoxine 5-phosphate synthase
MRPEKIAGPNERKEDIVRLAVNIDHFATLREARKHTEPEPVLAALLAEQAGAEGIVCHLRSDRRHIKERDLLLLRESIKTKLNVEMAATTEMQKVAIKVRPDVVSLVPERPEELTTEGGLNVVAGRGHLGSFARRLRKAGIRVSIFIDPDIGQIRTAGELGIDLVEINTGRFADLRPGIARDEALAQIIEAAEYGRGLGLEVHAGHGLDYHNVLPIVAIPQISELSIGFSIVARSAIVGLDKAVREMRALVEKR